MRCIAKRECHDKSIPDLAPIKFIASDSTLVINVLLSEMTVTSRKYVAFVII